MHVTTMRELRDEPLQPIAVRTDRPVLFALRCLLDLQLLTIVRFLRRELRGWRGPVLDVGAGEAPWRSLLPEGVEYVGVDVEHAGDFGMRRQPGIVYYDGIRLPFADGSFAYALCIEVLEHAPDAGGLLAEIRRVLRDDGLLVLTIPWSARPHHLPHDYARYTPPGLDRLLAASGFGQWRIEARGNDIAVLANKMLVLCLHLLRPARRVHLLWAWAPAAVLAVLALVFTGFAHLTLACAVVPRQDPLGYAVVATNTGRADDHGE